MKLSSYSQCERRGNISCERLIKLSEVLDVSCRTLLFGNTDTTIPETIKKTEKSEFTNREKMLINALRAFPAKKREAIYKITELTLKKQLDPSSFLEL